MTAITEVPPVFEKSVVALRATLFKMKHRELTLPAFSPGFMGKVVLRLHSLDFSDDRYFFSGTSCDEPLGIINSGAAITVPRMRVGSIGSVDIMKMLLSLYVDINGAPAWFVSSGWEGELYPAILRMQHYPIIYTDSLPEPGQTGDLILADFRHYLIGFSNDDPPEIDGMPGLKCPVEKDGHRESPFVILGEREQ